jgi:hypothetical protein
MAVVKENVPKDGTPKLITASNTIITMYFYGRGVDETVEEQKEWERRQLEAGHKATPILGDPSWSCSDDCPEDKRVLLTQNYHVK